VLPPDYKRALLQPLHVARAANSAEPLPKSGVS
jgi:hypothetical protein